MYCVALCAHAYVGAHACGFDWPFWFFKLAIALMLRSNKQVHFLPCNQLFSKAMWDQINDMYISLDLKCCSKNFLIKHGRMWNDQGIYQLLFWHVYVCARWSQLRIWKIQKKNRYKNVQLIGEPAKKTLVNLSTNFFLDRIRKNKFKACNIFDLHTKYFNFLFLFHSLAHIQIKRICH